MDKRKALGRGLGALIPGPQRSDSVSGSVAAAGRSEEHAPPEALSFPSVPGSGGGSGSLFGGASGGPVGGSAHPVPAPVAPAQREYFLCPIEEIMPSADNPRQAFDEQRLQELADSIKTQGLVQPLVVRLRSQEEHRSGGPSRTVAPSAAGEDHRPTGDGNHQATTLSAGEANHSASFVLIAGERRWRASQRAGLKDVPVVVKDVNAARAFELALVENLQREDLNAIEEAEAYRRLSDEFGYTQEELAQRVGRDRATVANSLRLLKLPASVRDLVARDSLSMGHARALLSLEQDDLIERHARRVADKQLSVRQTEALVRRAKQEIQADKELETEKKPEQKSLSVKDVEDRLQKSLGTRVRLHDKDGQAGRIEIEYHSLDELDRLLGRLIDGDLGS